MADMLGRVTLKITAFAPTTIVALGDSITHGVANENPVDLDGALGGYRQVLIDALIAAGHTDLTYLGSISDGPTRAVDHEGWNGFGIGGAGGGGQAPSDIATKGVAAATAYTPGFILVMGGTNDMLQPWSTAPIRASMGTRFATLLDDLHAASPTSIIIAATMPPIDPAQYTSGQVDSERTAFNASIATTVAARSPWARAVDPASSMSVATHIGGGVHPNGAGYAVIASAYQAAMQTALVAAAVTLKGVVGMSRMQGSVRMSRMRGLATVS